MLKLENIFKKIGEVALNQAALKKIICNNVTKNRHADIKYYSKR